MSYIRPSFLKHFFFLKKVGFLLCAFGKANNKLKLNMFLVPKNIKL